MKSQGQILKKLVRDAKIRQEDFAQMMGISRNYLLTILDKQTLKQTYIDKACKILNVNNKVFFVSESESNNDTIMELKSRVEMLEKLLESKERELESKEGENAALRELISILRGDKQQGSSLSKHQAT